MSHNRKRNTRKNGARAPDPYTRIATNPASINNIDSDDEQFIPGLENFRENSPFANYVKSKPPQRVPSPPPVAPSRATTPPPVAPPKAPTPPPITSQPSPPAFNFATTYHEVCIVLTELKPLLHSIIQNHDSVHDDQSIQGIFGSLSNRYRELAAFFTHNQHQLVSRPNTPDPTPVMEDVTIPHSTTDNSEVLAAIAALKISVEERLSKLESQQTPPPPPPETSCPNPGPKTFAQAARSSQPARHTPSQNPKPKPAKVQTKATPPQPKRPEPVRFVVRFRGNPPPPELRPSPVQIMSRLNALLSGNPLASGIGFVGSQWNKVDNLILIFTPDSPPSSIDRLIPGIRTALGLEADIPITSDLAWSRLIVSSVPARPSILEPVYSEDSILESLCANPDCKALNITRQPQWVRKPEQIKTASSFAISFQDPDGSIARRLLKTPLFVFGTSVTVKRWVDKPQPSFPDPRLNKESGAPASHEPMDT